MNSSYLNRIQAFLDELRGSGINWGAIWRRLTIVRLWWNCIPENRLRRQSESALLHTNSKIWIRAAWCCKCEWLKVLGWKFGEHIWKATVRTLQPKYTGYFNGKHHTSSLYFAFRIVGWQTWHCDQRVGPTPVRCRPIYFSSLLSSTLWNHLRYTRNDTIGRSGIGVGMSSLNEGRDIPISRQFRQCVVRNS